jgi:hypothetical protein
MYNFVKALCLSRSIGSQWKEMDIQDILVYDLFNIYTGIYLELSNIFLPGTVYVDMNTLRTEFSSYQGTLNEWLFELGTRALPTVPNLPNSQVKYVRYSDAIRSGYKIGITKIGSNLPDNYPAMGMEDLKVWRPRYTTDIKLLHSHCLLSVNGYYHRTDADENSAYVYQGATTLRKSKDNHLGILSFLDIGKVTKVPIKFDEIYAQDATSSLRLRTYVKLDQDLTGKSVFLVLGGYLVFPDENIFWQSSDNMFALNFSGIPMLERYFESHNYLDLSGLGLPQNTNNPAMVNVDDFFSDEIIKRYLTLSQSFFVVVDAPNLFTNKISLRHCNIPGMFTAYQDPTYPLIVNYGKVAEYWKVKENNRWSVNVTDSFFRNFVLTTNPIHQLVNVTDQKIPSKPFYFSHGHLLEIGSYQ